MFRESKHQDDSWGPITSFLLFSLMSFQKVLERGSLDLVLLGYSGICEVVH